MSSYAGQINQQCILMFSLGCQSIAGKSCFASGLYRCQHSAFAHHFFDCPLNRMQDYLDSEDIDFALFLSTKLQVSFDSLTQSQFHMKFFHLQVYEATNGHPLECSSNISFNLENCIRSCITLSTRYLHACSGVFMFISVSGTDVIDVTLRFDSQNNEMQRNVTPLSLVQFQHCRNHPSSHRT